METNEIKETKTTIKEKWENLKEKKWFRRTVIGLGIGAGIGAGIGGAVFGLKKLCGSTTPEALPELTENAVNLTEETVEHLD